ncbi:unnamed protein product [Rotaria sordida]|uniref:Cadherin domain-containing protein n=1 Tax=Rotaria sordida TaxID=392033 RepID=A0A818K7N7_9BILA|nr:unnamed protein product [Rotaria sordida]CAF1050710.1 unnamed protein product [Rotaria sordida]CAF1074065.1 unnamed protein product [Rotaria sordida]CAF1181916.1 unnamed protein product [Rotaria sordida]CAF1348922.1 unnamed protein product [Rotaria sordida]
MTIIYILIFISSVNSIAIDIRYPQFFHQSLNDSSIEITEGKSPGSFIAFINLVNDTNIISNEWLLNITDSDFKIQSNGLSYSLITTKILDRERKNFYEFFINAQHLIPPYEKLSKFIRIRILDINDCIPSFNQTIYQTKMIPNITNFIINAYDCDELNTENSRITYSLSNYQDLFRINETTGLIECIKNTHTYETYEIIVVARDYGKPSLSSTTLVQIKLISSINKKTPLSSSSSSLWSPIEQSPKNILLLAGILALLFVSMSLFICLICCIKYKIKRCKENNNLTTTTTTADYNNMDTILNEKKIFSSTSSTTSSNDLQQHTVNGEFTRITDDLHFERAAILYDAMNVFPNTYYLPLKRQSELIENINNSNNNDTSLHIPQSSSSTTSSPLSTNVIDTKTGSDDGCYCSSDMSSEQSNNLLLLNPSSLSTTNSKLSSKHVRFIENNMNTDGALKRFENLYGTRTTSDHCASYV